MRRTAELSAAGARAFSATGFVLRPPQTEIDASQTHIVVRSRQVWRESGRPELQRMSAVHSLIDSKDFDFDLAAVFVVVPLQILQTFWVCDAVFGVVDHAP